jgi:hypothetical protein
MNSPIANSEVRGLNPQRGLLYFPTLSKRPFKFPIPVEAESWVLTVTNMVSRILLLTYKKARTIDGVAVERIKAEEVKDIGIFLQYEVSSDQKENTVSWLCSKRNGGRLQGITRYLQVPHSRSSPRWSSVGISE